MTAHAEELNRVLENTQALRLLSAMGKRMYFPKGILSQSAEANAKATRFNATVGMAYEKGQPLMLDAVREELPRLSATEAVAYAPAAGVMKLREHWKKDLYKKNPSLTGKLISLPLVTPGLTAGISYVIDLFVDHKDSVIVPDMNWPNYRLVIEERKDAAHMTFPTFEGKGFNIKGFEEALRKVGEVKKRVMCILNFPNNPTGYSPTLEEADAFVTMFKRVADSGIDLLVACDDAYFGLQYEKGLLEESLFARLVDAHERILAVKVDGPTKEDYVWGFRSGFVTFGGKGLTEAHYDALVKKLMGIVRSSVSNSAAPTQYILLKALEHKGYARQKRLFHDKLAGRYRKVRAFVDREASPPCLKALPFNSGYFMSFVCDGISAEELRIRLLEEKGIGTISMHEKYLRVAFSSVEEEDVEELYREVYDMAAILGREKHK